MLPAGSSSTVRPAHRWRLPLLVLVLTVGAFLPAAAPAAVAGRPVPPPPAGPDPPPVPALWMPLTGAVVRGFDARAGPYGPGHRGIDIAAPVGEPVPAPAAGKVVFSGPVAGTTWVSLQVAPGVVLTLGPLLDPVTAGRVRQRAPVGRVGPGYQPGPAGPGGPGSGGPAGVGGTTLHLGIRVDGVYVDPLAYLVDRPRARLAPLAMPRGLPGR
jgi:murein DD-endopeptidase MepM/ murein hydrolase activator NlpD